MILQTVFPVFLSEGDITRYPLKPDRLDLSFHYGRQDGYTEEHLGIAPVERPSRFAPAAQGGRSQSVAPPRPNPEASCWNGNSRRVTSASLALLRRWRQKILIRGVTRTWPSIPPSVIWPRDPDNGRAYPDIVGRSIRVLPLPDLTRRPPWCDKAQVSVSSPYPQMGKDGQKSRWGDAHPWVWRYLTIGSRTEPAREPKRRACMPATSCSVILEMQSAANRGILVQDSS